MRRLSIDMSSRSFPLAQTGRLPIQSPPAIWESRRLPMANAGQTSRRRSWAWHPVHISPPSRRGVAVEALGARRPRSSAGDAAVDAVFGHRKHSIRAATDELLVVAGDEQGAAAAGEGPQDGGEIAPARGIERCRWFIHQQ